MVSEDSGFYPADPEALTARLEGEMPTSNDRTGIGVSKQIAIQGPPDHHL